MGCHHRPMSFDLSQLLNQAAQGDSAAIDRLVKRYTPNCLALATSLLGDADAAQDAVQEAWLLALGRLDQLRKPESFGAWLRQIVRSQCYRQMRRHWSASIETMPETPGNDPSPRSAAQLRQLQALVREAIVQLDQNRRRVVELYYLDELKHAQVAARLGIPEGTVKRRLHDARHRLRAIILGKIDPEGAKSSRRDEEIL